MNDTRHLPNHIPSTISSQIIYFRAGCIPYSRKNEQTVARFSYTSFYLCLLHHRFYLFLPSIWLLRVICFNPLKDRSWWCHFKETKTDTLGIWHNLPGSLSLAAAQKANRVNEGPEKGCSQREHGGRNTHSVTKLHHQYTAIRNGWH